MKRVLVGAVVATLVVASPSLAAVKKKPKPAPKPKPIPMALYLHGSQAVGELDAPAVNGALPMDASKPSSTSEKSILVTNYVGGPNWECAGNGLLPFWEGPVSGTLTGAYKIVLHTAAAPGSSVRVRLFDSPGGIACDDEMPTPLVEKIVTVPQGNDGVVTIAGAFASGKEVKSGMVQLALSPPGVDGSQVRVFYDATTATSMISLNCLPKTGKKTC